MRTILKKIFNNNKLFTHHEKELLISDVCDDKVELAKASSSGDLAVVGELGLKIKVEI